MQVYLDGEALAVEPTGLSNALAAAADRARSRGRVVIEARADGALLQGDALDSDQACRELRLVSADPRNLVSVTLGDAAATLRDLATEQTRVADMITTDRMKQALPDLRAIFQTWQTIKDLVERSGQLLELSVDRLTLPGVGADENFSLATQQLLQDLRLVREALAREDWSALADSLSYELRDAAALWERLVLALSRHVSAMPPRCQESPQ